MTNGFGFFYEVARRALVYRCDSFILSRTDGAASVIVRYYHSQDDKACAITEFFFFRTLDKACKGY